MVLLNKLQRVSFSKQQGTFKYHWVLNSVMFLGVTMELRLRQCIPLTQLGILQFRVLRGEMT